MILDISSALMSIFSALSSQQCAFLHSCISASCIPARIPHSCVRCPLGVLDQLLSHLLQLRADTRVVHRAAHAGDDTTDERGLDACRQSDVPAANPPQP